MTDPNQNSGDPTATDTLFKTPTDPVVTEPENLSLSKDQLEEILKQNSHAQTHIKKIEEENEELRKSLQTTQQELSNSASFEDLLNGLETSKSPNSSEPTAPQLDKDSLLASLKEEVFAELNAAQVQTIENANLAESVSLAQEAYGEKYEEHLLSVASDLVLDQSYLDSMAKSSPKAFMQLIGQPQQSKTPSPTLPSVTGTPGNPNALDQQLSVISKKRNLATEEGREANRLWQDKDFQRQQREAILNRAEEAGSEFGNKF